MSMDVLLGIVGAAGILAAGGYVIHHWGPGVSRRIVRCPEKRAKARVSLLWRETSFGAVRAEDVLSCSLLPNGQVDCDKKCLSRV